MSLGGPSGGCRAAATSCKTRVPGADGQEHTQLADRRSPRTTASWSRDATTLGFPSGSFGAGHRTGMGRNEPVALGGSSRSYCEGLQSQHEGQLTVKWVPFGPAPDTATDVSLMAVSVTTRTSGGRLQPLQSGQPLLHLFAEASKPKAAFQSAAAICRRLLSCRAGLAAQ